MNEVDANKLVEFDDDHSNTVGPDMLQYLWDSRLDPLFWHLARQNVTSAWFEHVPFAHWLVQVTSPRLLVELGTQAGVSYSAFCESVLLLGLTTQCFAVDTWKGDEHASYYGEEVFRDFQRFHAARYGAFSELLRCTFDEALAYVADDSVDLLHIDGLHTYEAVRHDFDSWLPKLSGRAVVLFHDTNVRERDFGVWRLWLEIKKSYPSFEFLHGHGLGLLAVGREAPGEVAALCQLNDPAKLGVIRRRFALIGKVWSTLWEADEARTATSMQISKAQSEANAQLLKAQSEANAQLLKAQSETDAQFVAIERLHADEVLRLRQAVTEAVGEGERLSGRISELERVCDHAKKRNTAAMRQIADLQQTVSHLRRATAEREGVIAKELISQVQQKYAALAKEADMYRSEYSKAVSSRSWKITAPLRSLSFHLTDPWRRISEQRRLRGEAQLVEGSSLFQAQWYLQTYPDVEAAGVNPGLHYLVDGWKEGRDPSPLFSTRWYLERNEDVNRAGVNPLLHFIRFGAKECRMPSQTFTTVPWLESYKPSVLAYLAGSSHFLKSTSARIEKPYISIIILNLNKAFLTLQCLISLWEHTDDLSYEIIVVDNASTPEDLQTLHSLKGPFRLIPLTLNRYFGEGNNIGAEAAEGDLLVFMNNDVVVTRGWLTPLVKTLREKADCGAVGPKFIYPDGRLQEAGGYIKEDGLAVQRGKGQEAGDDAFQKECTVDYVSAATVMVDKNHFRKVGGFDFRWEPAYYEDVDLCLKLRCLGLKTYYVPQSTVIHYENATSGDDSHGLQLHNMVEVNRKKLVERWNWYFKARETTGMPDGLLPDVRDGLPHTSVTDDRAALFTPYNLIPGGGERYLLTLAEVLAERYKVTLVTPERFSSLRIANVARELRISIPKIGVSALREARDENFDVWVAMGNAIVPPAPAQGKLSILIVQFPFPLTSQSIEEGRRWWDEYDLVVVYSEYVKKHLVESARRYAFSTQKIEVICPPVLVDGINTKIKKGGHSILSVGRFFAGGHCKNQHLMIEAFRTIARDAGELGWELHLVGSLHPEAEHREYFQYCRKLAEGLPVFFHLDASFGELQRLYEYSSIYWHAAGLNSDLASCPETAEHFGISVVEAMSAGCIPIVYAYGGPTEIIEDGVSGLLYNDVDQLIAFTKQVAGEWMPYQTDAMRAAARARASCYDTQAFKAAWQSVISRRTGLGQIQM